MEFPWDKQNETGEASTSLAAELTTNIMLDLDDKTLQCLVAAEGPSLAVNEERSNAGTSSAGPSTSGRDKRKRGEDLAFSSWLSDKFGDEEGEEEEGESACTTCPACKLVLETDQAEDSQRRIGRKGKPMSNAAVAKASREKARRERLNECFEELARLCDPTGRGIKTDRVSVVADAIRALTQLRVENNQLRQLNKFLEERVAGYERARAQSVFQQTLLQQQQPSQLLVQGTVGPTSLHHSSATGSPFLRADSAPALPSGGPTPPPSAHIAGYEAFVPMASSNMDYSGLYGPLMAQQGMLGPAHLKGEQLGGLTGVELTARLEENVTVTDGAGAMAWLPAPNATEDGKLRPPAA